MNKNISDKYIFIDALFKQSFGKIVKSDNGFDAEDLSSFVLTGLSQTSLIRNWPGISNLLSILSSELKRQHSSLEQTLFKCNFSNPIGLAAGFDKDGVAAAIWEYFGFGFAELGTVTNHAQEGNPRPRLFRLATEEAALNRMGFNNKGAEKMYQTLQRQNLNQSSTKKIPIGINFGKSKITPLDDAVKDYESSLSFLTKFADYAVINVSSPNTPGLRSLQTPQALKQIINRLQSIKNCPPLFIKIAPDLNNQEIYSITKVACEEKITGIIAVNTSLERLGLENRIISQTGSTLSNEQGGLSGKPLREKANEILRLIYKASESKLIIIGVGGIHSSQAAWERISSGASLIQIYTSWIFKGPIIVPNILDDIIMQLKKHGLNSIQQAIGSELPWIE